jgi:beta-galactosidase
VRGEVGIVVVPESQLFTFAQQGNTEFYAASARGAYQGFFANNIQADWVHLDQISEYDFLYLPFPVMLTQRAAELLRDWVAAGGTLVSEGCPGYFRDRGRAGTRQPNLGLDELFGAREAYVEFTPDLLGELTFRIDEREVRGGTYLQAYEPTTGTAVGWYGDGQVAVVDHCWGKGRTRLIGTFPGVGIHRDPNEGSRQFFGDLLRWAGKKPHVRVDPEGITARLHDGAGGTYVWVLNPRREPQEVRLALADTWGPFGTGERLWGQEHSDPRRAPEIEGRRVRLFVGDRDGLVVRLAGRSSQRA